MEQSDLKWKQEHFKAALLLLDTRWQTIINTYHIKPLWSELQGWQQTQ